MKTIKNFNKKNSLTFLLAASILFLASCKKESLLPLTKSGNDITYGSERQVIGSSGIEALPVSSLIKKSSVNMIKIDHSAARTHAPDYCITIRFDGTIIFDGRRNTAFRGTKEWKLDMNKFYAVKQLFIHSGFNSIEDNLSLMADVPMVYTTWCALPTDFSKTLFDYNGDYPEGLISLRVKAEQILDLWLLIYPDPVPVPVQQAASY